MNPFAERLKKLRSDQHLSQNALAGFIGVSKSSVNMYERGEREPGFNTVAAIADYFKVDIDYLLGKSEFKNKNEWLQSVHQPIKSEETGVILREDSAAPEIRRLPLLEEVSGGEPVFTPGGRECCLNTGAGVSADFCIRARGDSMQGARIMDGDLVFIRRQPMVDNGEIAAVIVDEDASLKRVYYYPKDEKLSLNAENPHYAPLIYIGEELRHVRILGKAVAFQSRLQ